MTPSPTTNTTLAQEADTMLLGSNVQPSHVNMSGTQVQLGDIVRAAVKMGDYTAKQWNDLPDEQREAKIADARIWMARCYAEPGGIMAGNPNGPMGDIVKSELIRQLQVQVLALSVRVGELDKECEGEREARAKLDSALREKDAAMGELFKRLSKAGVDCSDLIS